MPGVDQVGSFQGLIERAPLAFVAAFFAVAFLSLFWVHLRSKDKHELTVAQLNERHDSELAAINTEKLKIALEQATLLGTLIPLLVEVKQLLPKRKPPRATPRKPLDPTLVTQIDAGKAARDADD